MSNAMTEQEFTNIEARHVASSFFSCDDPEFVCHYRSDMERIISACREQRVELEHYKRALGELSRKMAIATRNWDKAGNVDNSSTYWERWSLQNTRAATKEAPCQK